MFQGLRSTSPAEPKILRAVSPPGPEAKKTEEIVRRSDSGAGSEEPGIDAQKSTKGLGSITAEEAKERYSPRASKTGGSGPGSPYFKRGFVANKEYEVIRMASKREEPSTERKD